LLMPAEAFCTWEAGWPDELVEKIAQIKAQPDIGRNKNETISM
jgi:hypothetical protein